MQEDKKANNGWRLDRRVRGSHLSTVARAPVPESLMRRRLATGRAKCRPPCDEDRVVNGRAVHDACCCCGDCCKDDTARSLACTHGEVYLLFDACDMFCGFLHGSKQMLIHKMLRFAHQTPAQVRP